ncbi:phosphodiesterase [Anaerolentibacter hominis]|uniref:phosphodiesterase n=1 Tax=Anaerolentibacter hominis TaxID=3079009 RepID=UPI0031B842A5
MKLMIASDIHGSAYYCRALKEAWEREKPEKLILLGDLLYHGPRNDLPKEYNPKEVIGILNGMKDELLCVRGNCEAEVDQMVLEFPVLADYMILYLDGKMVFVTHGHLFHENQLPPLKAGDILLHGHTHIKENRGIGDYLYLNPGSVSLPKDDDVHSYMIYEDGKFTIRELFSSRIIK